LKNNVSTRLLETTLNHFPAGTEDYVSHAVLKDYIQDTAVKSGVNELTQYDTEVRNVSKNGKLWSVDTTTLQSDSCGDLTRKSTSTVSSHRLKTV
jgi:cation diffusion facilitator CzcD-associated flavoprotein CzcO